MTHLLDVRATNARILANGRLMYGTTLCGATVMPIQWNEPALIEHQGFKSVNPNLDPHFEDTRRIDHQFNHLCNYPDDPTCEKCLAVVAKRFRIK